MANIRQALLRRSPTRKRGPNVGGIDTPNSPLGEGSQETASARYRLMAWLSPAYPVGGFSYSSGLEWVIEAGDIKDPGSLQGWLATMLEDGAGFCDAVFFTHVHRACTAGDAAALREVAELAAGLVSSRERFLETTAQGRAFLEITQATWPCAALDLVSLCRTPVTYPVAVGAAAAGHGIPLEQSLSAYLQALAANWVSAAVRLVPLGQTDGQRAIAALEPVILATVERALGATLEDAGSKTFRADIASMHHEIQYTRLFRS